MGFQLFKALICLYALCKLTAYEFCTLCYYCSELAIPGGHFDQYKLRPDREQTGRYQQFLDQRLPSGGPFYYCPTPLNERRAAQRQIKHIPIRLPSVAIGQEINADPGHLERFRAKGPDDRMAIQNTNAYKCHPLVEASEQRGLPKPLALGIYIDGVRFTAISAGRIDSVIGIWLVNLFSQKRHLLATLRTLDLCRCGCRGWCSIFAILYAIAWDLEGLAKGERSCYKHDGTAWDPSDIIGNLPPLLCTAILLWIKGDWAEHVKTLGLSGWGSKHCPCIFCGSVKACLHSRYHLMSALSFPFPLRSSRDYDAACRDCEKEVCLAGPHDLALLYEVGKLQLVPDKGFVLLAAVVVGSVSLLAGDRLEPSSSRRKKSQQRDGSEGLHCDATVMPL